MLRRIINRFGFALNGIKEAVFFDRSFASQFYGGILIISALGYIFFPLSQFEIALAFLAWILVLITELQNSAFESALDHLHPDQHQSIGKSKDMAAGSVLLAGFFALFVLVLILHNHIPLA